MLTDLTNIPKVMRKLSWLNGARLLESWFGRAPAASPVYSTPDLTTIRLDTWALTFQRAKTVYDQLIRERIWANPPARLAVGAMLRRKGLLLPAPVTRSFGWLTDPVDRQDPDYINQRSCGDYTTFDDLTGALGNFNFRVVVAGTVGPVPVSGNRVLGSSGYQVEIAEIGIYIRDSFSFEGDQYLGCWSDNDFTPIMPPTTAGDLWTPPLFLPVGNRSFREWRDRNSRGGDFLVFSDMKRVRLDSPDRFVVT